MQRRARAVDCPHLMEIAEGLRGTGHDDDVELPWALDRILDGRARLRCSEAAAA